MDPVRDLIPVYPNCHTALHSKPDGVYGIEELKTIKHQQIKESKQLATAGLLTPV